MSTLGPNDQFVSGPFHEPEPLQLAASEADGIVPLSHWWHMPPMPACAGGQGSHSYPVGPT